jgi:hypothetical protein
MLKGILIPSALKCEKVAVLIKDFSALQYFHFSFLYIPICTVKKLANAQWKFHLICL